MKEGELLVRLDENKLTAALAEAETNLKLNEATLERNKQLFREKLLARELAGMEKMRMR